MPLDLTTPHQVTVNLTGVPATTRNYTSPNGSPTPWTGADGWTVSAGATQSVSADGLNLLVTAATAYTAKTVTSAAGEPNDRRVRALLVLNDPEARPARAWISDNTGSFGAPPDDNSGSADWSQLVSGIPVWIEGWMPRNGPTSVRINVAKPAGAPSTAVTVLAVVFDHLNSNAWNLTADDANGHRVLTSHLEYDVPAGGTVAYVDREPSLVGTVTYTYTPLVGSPVVLAGAVATTGWAVLGRVDTTALHQVFLVSFTGTYRAQAQPVPIIDAELPSVAVRPFASREGQLVCYFDTLDAAELVAASLRTGEVHQLRQPATGRQAMDAYLIATAVTVGTVLDELTTPKWMLQVSYVETERGGYVRSV